MALDHAALVALDPSITLDQSLHIFMPAFVKDMLSQDDVEKLVRPMGRGGRVGRTRGRQHGS